MMDRSYPVVSQQTEQCLRFNCEIETSNCMEIFRWIVPKHTVSIESLFQIE